MNGFVFPALTLWSGGDDAVIVETPDVRHQFSNLEFLHLADQVSSWPREEVEQNLFELVTAVLDRVSRNRSGSDLRENWERVLECLADDEQRRYCIAAGRLGIDPYDPDALDLTVSARGLSSHLFSDICEATTAAELPEAAEWSRGIGRRLSSFPSIDVGEFGAMPVRDLRAK